LNTELQLVCFLDTDAACSAICYPTKSLLCLSLLT